PFFTRAGDRRIDDLLSDPAHLRSQRSEQRLTGFQMMNEMLDGIAMRRSEYVDGQLSSGAISLRLHANRRFEIITADITLATDNDETAFRLRLLRPGIGESAPARFEF